MATIQTNQRPTVQGTQQAAPRQEVRAQVGNYQTAPAADNSDLHGLVQGLASFNPALQSLQGAMQAETDLQLQKDITGNQKALVQGQALAEQAKVDPYTGAALEMPADVPTAYQPAVVKGFNHSIGLRMGALNQRDAADEFSANQRDPAFMAKVNDGSWMAEKRQKALGGITDPTQQELVGRAFDALDVDIAGKARADASDKRTAALMANASAITAATFTADKTPEQMAEALPAHMAAMQAQGLTDAESAQIAFNQLHSLSVRGGGMPHLFDVLDTPMANGKTLLQSNPSLTQHALTARTQATAQADKAAEDAAMPARTEALDNLGQQAALGKLDPEKVYAMVGPKGILKHPSEALHYLNINAKAQAQNEVDAQMHAEYLNGTLGREKPAVQQAQMDIEMNPMLDKLWDSKNDPSINFAGTLATVVKAWNTAGATEVPSSAARFIASAETGMPNPKGPTDSFKVAAQLYSGMSATPEARAKWFPEKSAMIFDAYNAAVGAGGGKGDPQAAYEAAYLSQDPTRIKAATERMGSQETKKMLKDAAASAMEGTSWRPKWMFGDHPADTSIVEGEARAAAQAYLQRNPTASTDQVKAFASNHIAANWVFDTASQQPVKIPPGTPPEQAQRVLSENSAKLIKELSAKLPDSGDGWKVIYAQAYGDPNAFTQTLVNGMAAMKSIPGTVSMRKLLDDDTASRVLNDQERAQIGAFKADNSKGLPPALFAKAQNLGRLTGKEVDAYTTNQTNQFMQRMKDIPAMTFGDPSSGLAQPLPRGNASIDNKRTAQVAADFIQNPVHGELGMAASLTTMGESMALRAYDDPARGAGKNIGMGYNLDANAGHLVEDFKAAGIPAEKIDDVKAGRAEITPQQAQRLLINALPRYAKQAESNAEAAQPGLWKRMLPAQRAVMTDIAYQAGGGEKFPKAFAALAKGDAETFANETKVFYTNRAGARVEDTRRGGLRASLLAGGPRWSATIQKSGSYPSGPLDALALRQ